MKRETFIKTLICAAFVGFIFCLGASTARAQTTAFTYQGKLSDGSTAARGSYDLGFALYDAETGGTQIGTALTRSNVAVSGGVFTVSLDFGASAFSGANRFLQIAVKKTTETNFTTLTPRQPVASTPYSLQSLNAATANTAATATNSQQLGGLAASNYLRTTGSGANLRDLNASTVTSGTLDDDRLSANVARRDIPNIFVGSQTFNRNIAQTGGTTNLNLTDGFVVRGALNTGTIPATGAGARMMFYPRKAAFRAGQVEGDQWDDANVGLYSSAFGLNARATNQTAFAVGESALASGRDSVAFGFQATASGSSSTALGYQTTAGGLASTALGSSSTASGSFSTALGSNTTASGSQSTAMGSLASTNGKEGAFAEDFYREFKLGTDDKSIGLLDIAGVNTAAIKELDDEMQNTAAEIKTLRTENDALESRVKNQQQQKGDLKTIVCAMKPDAEVCRDKRN